MMITYFGIIVLQLVERIAITLSEVKKYNSDVLGFSYPALRTRHEVPRKPYLQETQAIKSADETNNYC